MRPPLRLRLFGGPALDRDGSEVALTPLQRATLAVVAGGGSQGVRSEDVLALLWSDGTDARLRRRLSQCVYSLHRRIGVRLLRTSADHWSLDPAQAWSDLEELTEALEQRNPTRAAALVTMGFCSQLGYGVTSELDQWIHEKDLAFRSSLRALVAEMWSAGEREADWAASEVAAEAWMALEPRNERVLGRLLRAMALRGRVREAEAAYDRFRSGVALLDPGWAPEPETEEILSSLTEMARRRLGDLPAPEASVELPLVGRTDLLERIVRILDGVDGTAGAILVVVVGEAGIGKTRLLREAFSLLPSRTRVVQANCSESESNIPFGSLSRALDVEWVANAVRGLGSPWEGLLARVLPHLWLGELPDDPAVGPEQIPLLLREAILRLLRRGSEEAPVVLFMDDAHHMDASSASLLTHLGDRWAGPGLAIVVAVRPDELLPDSAMGRWVTHVERRGATRIVVGRLTPEAVRALVEHVVAWRNDSEGSEPTADLDAFVELSRGHPLLAVECVLGRRPEVSAVGGDEGPITGAVQRTVAARFSDLSTGAKSLLASLAPSERPLPFTLLEAMCGVSERLFREAFDEAIGERFLETTSAGIGFRHGLIREAIYESLRPTERIDAHRSIARALGSLDDPLLATEIALHLFAAAEPTEATPYAIRAAEAGIRSGGLAEARGLLERVLEAGVAGLLGAQAALLFARVTMLQGDFDRSAEISDLARDRFTTAGASEDALLARLRGLEARFLAPGGDRDYLLEEVRRARKVASDRGMARAEADAMSLEVRILDGLRRAEDVRGITKAARRYHGKDDRSRLSFLFVAMHDAVYGDPAGAAATAGEAAEIAEKLGDTDALMRTLNWRIIALGNQALLNTEEGRAVIERARAVAEEVDDLEQRFRYFANLGSWRLDAGEYDAAEVAWELADESLTALPAPHLRRSLGLCRGQWALETGDLESARRYLEGVLGETGVSDYSPLRWVAQSALGLVALGEGSLRNARDALASVPDLQGPWTFDPTLWISLKARVQAIGGHVPAILRSVATLEGELREAMAPAWMRARLLRISLAQRHEIALPETDIMELEGFLHARELNCRLQELSRR